MENISFLISLLVTWILFSILSPILMNTFIKRRKTMFIKSISDKEKIRAAIQFAHVVVFMGWATCVILFTELINLFF